MGAYLHHTWNREQKSDRTKAGNSLQVSSSSSHYAKKKNNAACG